LTIYTLEQGVSRMKMSIINFSHRKKGNSDLVVRLLQKFSEKDGLDPLVVHAREFPLKPCTGCMRCVFHHPGRCVQEDDLETFFEALRCEAVFLVSPVYFLTPVAEWKRLQDRMLAFLPYVGKSNGHCGIVLTAGLKGWSVADHLLSVLALSAGLRVSTAATCFGPGPGQIVMDENNLKKIERTSHLVMAGETEKKVGHCHVCYHPLFTSAGRPYCPVCDAHVDESGEIRFEDSRWHPDNLARHYHEWVSATRHLYRDNRHEIRRKINELNLHEPD